MARDLERSVETWRARRYAALRAPLGWLTLAGLDWLEPGVSRLGSDPGSDIVLPGGPEHAGVIELRDGTARASGAAPGAMTVNGAPVRDLTLVSDVDASEAEPPTTLEIGPFRVRLIRRGAIHDRFGLRTWDVTSPAPQAFGGIPHWPVDPASVVEARFVAAAVGATVQVPDVLGDLIDMPTPGQVRFELDGEPCELRTVEGGAGGELWLIFADATSGGETYGGGRFLYTDPPRADGTVTIDFNRAYNPPCVFSPFATCPLPPAGNRLGVPVRAGERSWHPSG